MLKNQLSFGDGIITIYTVTNTAGAGNTPTETLSSGRKLMFENRTIGAARFYAAQEAGVKLDRTVLVPLGASITPQDIAIITSEDSNAQYAIKQIQNKTDTKPFSRLLSLERIGAVYDVATV